MPRLILKYLPYFKAGTASKHAANLLEYIATRDGVEYITDANRTLPATKKQKDLIDKILRDFPAAKNIFEHEDYESRPTIENASEFITQALEQHMHEIGDKSYYVKYIAERPHVEKTGAHGLFTTAGVPIVLSQVQREVAEHTGNIWTPIISLRREDAVRLSYDNANQWQALLRSQAAEIAGHMKIHPDNFRWYAAFHNEAHHPHVHMMCWSTDPKEGYLTEQGGRDMKSSLARQIFRQDLAHIYEQQTDRRGKLGTQSHKTMLELCGQIRTGICGNPELELLIMDLSKRLTNTGGKKVYGFLKPNVKAIVDQIVDELAKDKRVAACYDAWYEMREEVLRTYHDEMPPRVPLSAQKEFKQIKNMVIAEALSLGGFAFADAPMCETLPDDVVIPDMEVDEAFVDADMPPLNVEQEVTGGAELHANWTNEYKQARAYLFGSAGINPDFDKAFMLFIEEAGSGNTLAMHDLGRMHADGLGREIDADTSSKWYSQALAGFHQIESEMQPYDHKATYLRYRIGKMYMTGLGSEQDYTKAVAWLSNAAEDGHKYAQYSLGSLYYRGLGVEQDYKTAFNLYTASAAQKNAYASYELAKMYRDGVGAAANADKAHLHFETAYNEFVAMEVDSSDDKLQYRIGQMLRDGVGVEVRTEEAEYYFERSAQLGNPHAQYALAKMYLAGEVDAKISAAVELLQKSADGGYPTAQYALGKLYRDGEHMEKDITRAVELFIKAAEQNNDFAAYALGKIYLAGEDVPKDIQAAIRWLTESAELGNQFAQYQIGKIYLAGEDVPKDIQAAIRWLTESAELGNQFAQYQSGMIYLAGEDMQKDVQAAIRWLTKSADQGNQFAQYQLGKIYIIGKDVSRDKGEALRWFTMAAEQGNEYAQFFIDHIDEIGVQRNPDLVMATTRLLQQLGKIFEQQQQNLQHNAQAMHIDRKRMRVLRDKKLAQGHALDEQVQNY